MDDKIIDLRVPLSPATSVMIFVFGVIPTKQDFAILREHINVLEMALTPKAAAVKKRGAYIASGKYKRDLGPCTIHPDAEREPRTNVCVGCKNDGLVLGRQIQKERREKEQQHRNPDGGNARQDRVLRMTK